MMHSHSGPGTCTFEGLEDHRESLLRFLRRRLEDENDVRDLAQEALVRGARYRRSEMDPKRLRGWLIRIAANLQADLQRRRRSEPALVGDSWVLEDLSHSHSDPRRFVWQGLTLGWAEALDHLRAALGTLPEADRRMLEGYYACATPTLELARSAGIPGTLVKVRLFRARRKLRDGLEKRL
ncbi:MAG TPA: RNA polymerase sigma factor, partial [Planctomycetota bacterium]|nr:RNA polymerase sigma factor [Planctomycetota bacterium]